MHDEKHRNQQRGFKGEARAPPLWMPLLFIRNFVKHYIHYIHYRLCIFIYFYFIYFLHLLILLITAQPYAETSDKDETDELRLCMSVPLCAEDEDESQSLLHIRLAALRAQSDARIVATEMQGAKRLEERHSSTKLRWPNFNAWYISKAHSIKIH